MSTNTTARNYWLALAATYGLTLSVVAMADWPWPLFMGGAFILFVVLLSLRYRQAGRKIQGRLGTAGPGVGFAGSILGAGALLVRGTPVAAWAGPLLGVIAFLGVFLYLQRFGRSHGQTSESAT
ncbi:hypothetical protein [Pseudarthrobacter polychromogenes]|uniref:Transmembrane protein n=1 Tax=Pseudarthrobacter polychromogenes TaxID=1676 RepID=A0ABQ1XQV3_9MICC|nr:hypothetical protein [Pseudarthrobacter polychromogenes]GGH00806.1 hypothetical protein GCM10011577_25670 [Pseudarthrobacter polychromogenes]